MSCPSWSSSSIPPSGSRCTDDAYAHSVEAHTGFHGKNEAWVVLDAEPGAEIVYGVKRPVSREELEAAARDGSILELLNFVPVQAGNVIYIPAGTIHALGPGLLVYEVQQRSDLTYRLYDYGRGRPLHLKKALDVANLEPQPLHRGRLQPGTWFETPHFRLGLWDGEVKAPGDRFFTLVSREVAAPGVVLGAGQRFHLGDTPWFVASP